MYRMRKDFNDYSVYVFDLDGTLYDQPRLRMIMAARLAAYYLCRPHKIAELFILQHFRKVKEGWTVSSSEEDIIEQVAKDKNTSAERVRAIVRKWIYDNPLSALIKTKDDELISRIKNLRENGRTVVILSDYPTHDKLEALGVSVDREYSPEDKRIKKLKPSPDGLKVIMSDLGVKCEDVLMIGDREEKDGEAAKAAGVDHIILARKVSKRDHNGFKG